MVIAERRRTCELTAELFAITYTRYQSAQISLRFVYRGVFTGGDSFVRYLGLFLYSTEWYFEPVARISAHLKLFRKILFRNILICRGSSVSSPGCRTGTRLEQSKHTPPQKYHPTAHNFLNCRGSSVVSRLGSRVFTSTLGTLLSNDQNTPRNTGRTAKPQKYFLHRPSVDHFYDQRDSKQFMSFSLRALYACYWQSLTLLKGRKTL